MILEAVLLSCKVAACSVAVVTIPGIWLGWVLVRKQVPGRELLISLTNIPLVIPPVATGYILLKVLGRNGAIGNLLHSWFGIQLTFNWGGAVIASALISLPLMVRAVRIAVEQVDPKLEEAALSMGAGPIRTFLSVTLPLSFPGIAAGAILAFARSLGEFGATITFAGNIPGETQTLPLAIHQLLQMPNGDSKAATLVAISVVLAVVATVLAEILVSKSLVLANVYNRTLQSVLSRTQNDDVYSPLPAIPDQETG